PVGRPEPDEGRNDVDAERVLDGARVLVGLRRAREQAEAVAQPLDGGAGDEDGPFERIGRPAPLVARHGSEKPVRRLDWLLTGVEEEKASSAVGVLRQAGRGAALAEEPRLLVARDP